MAGTFSQLHYHIIFSTKNRTPTIEPAWRERLWKYLGGIVEGEGGIPLRIGGVADHVHLLITLLPKHDVSSIVQKLKANSSGWVHKHFPGAGMWWQEGFGAFTVSHSGLNEVDKYIANQESRHRTMTFQEEFLIFLEKHGIPYDERFIWK
jgi:REP element-mobilizing transposase RayT